MLTTKLPPLARALPPDQRKTHTSYVRAAGSFVPKLTAKAFERYGFHSAEIMTAWHRVAGRDIAAISAPERIKWPRGGGAEAEGAGQGGATLVLRVDPAHALDVDYRSAEIADRINRYFGYRAVTAVKIIQAPLLAKSASAAAATPMQLSIAAEPPQEIAAIPDGALKSALSALWSAVAEERARP